jgi:hypothetical protein
MGKPLHAELNIDATTIPVRDSIFAVLKMSDMHPISRLQPGRPETTDKKQ